LNIITINTSEFSKLPDFKFKFEICDNNNCDNIMIMGLRIIQVYDYYYWYLRVTII